MKAEKKIIERIVYSKICPKCKKKITGFSESQVEWNLNVHINQKHKKNE